MEQLYGITELAVALGCCRTDAYLQVQAALRAVAAGQPVAWWLVPAGYKPKGARREVFFRHAQIEAAYAAGSPAASTVFATP